MSGDSESPHLAGCAHLEGRALLQWRHRCDAAGPSAASASPLAGAAGEGAGAAGRHQLALHRPPAVQHSQGGICLDLLRVRGRLAQDGERARARPQRGRAGFLGAEGSGAGKGVTGKLERRRPQRPAPPYAYMNRAAHWKGEWQRALCMLCAGAGGGGPQPSHGGDSGQREAGQQAGRGSGGPG